MVALYHSRINSSIWGSSLVENGDLFVDFFFVLSGFVIAANYQRSLMLGRGLARFMTLRFWRLYPLHIAVLAAYIALELAEALFLDGKVGGTSGDAFTGSRSALAILSNLILVHSLGIHDSLTWNYPSWSISTEFYTYLLYAVSLVWLRSRARLGTLLALAVLPVLLWHLNEGSIRTTWDYGLLRCAYGFLSGVIVWNLVELLGEREGGEGTGRIVVGSRIMMSIAEIAAVAGVVFYVSQAHGSSTLAAPVVFSVAVLVFSTDRGIVSKFLGTRIPRLLGAWSYSIYMVHVLTRDVAFGLARVSERADVEMLATIDGETLLGVDIWQGNLMLIMYILTVLVLAAATYSFVEVPGRNFGRRRAALSVTRSLSSSA